MTDHLAVLEKKLASSVALAEADPDLAPHLQPEIDAYSAAIALMRGQSEAMPADTCPYWKRVLLWLPSIPGYAETWWIGQRCGGDSRNHGYDEQWKISTPFSQMSQSTGINQQVWVGDAPKPLYWAPLPPNMDRQNDTADEQ